MSIIIGRQNLVMKVMLDVPGQALKEVSDSPMLHDLIDSWEDGEDTPVLLRGPSQGFFHCTYLQLDHVEPYEGPNREALALCALQVLFDIL
jgi:hypothetical protein